MQQTCIFYEAAFLDDALGRQEVRARTEQSGFLNVRKDPSIDCKAEEGKPYGGLCHNDRRRQTLVCATTTDQFAKAVSDHMKR
jgi:hypothetical protein